MSTSPPLFNIVTALAGHVSRMPSNMPASAYWLLNPTAPRISLEHREAMIQQLLDYFYSHFPPELVTVWKAEAAGLPPSEALRHFSTHLDDWYPESFLNSAGHGSPDSQTR